jgi:hypothetical protein
MAVHTLLSDTSRQYSDQRLLETGVLVIQFLGDHSERDPPVPIPNTVVKPLSPDGTARASVWESRKSPGLFLKPDLSIGRAFHLVSSYRMLRWLPLILCCSTWVNCAVIQGKVVDPGSASIHNAGVRVLPDMENGFSYSADSRHDGTFSVNNVSPGTYTVAIAAPGFREKIIRGVVVRASAPLDFGPIKLEIAGCDAPGVICHFIGKFPAKPVSRGELSVGVGCGLDLDKGKMDCTATRASDFRVLSAGDNRIFVEPRNGAALVDCGDASRSERVRIDGFGRGSVLCVRTSEGRNSQVFFLREVRSDTDITIQYVTRK